MMTTALSTDAAAAPVTAAPTRRRSATIRLLRTELRLVLRDPLTLTFVFVFPVLTMLIIGGAFGRTPDEAFGGVDPAHWYVASYFTVVIGATGLIMLPVHIASYRERGVLRRLAISGFARWSFAAAQLAVGLLMIAAGGVTLLLVAAPVYGVPEVHDLPRVLAGVTAGSVAFVSIGVLLGSVVRSARSAQALGMLLFFPSFLLGVGGPPPHVMGPALRHVASILPLGLVTNSVREPWLGIGNAGGSLAVVVSMAVAATALAARRTAL